MEFLSGLIFKMKKGNSFLGIIDEDLKFLIRKKIISSLHKNVIYVRL